MDLAPHRNPGERCLPENSGIVYEFDPLGFRGEPVRNLFFFCSRTKIPESFQDFLFVLHASFNRLPPSWIAPGYSRSIWLMPKLPFTGRRENLANEDFSWDSGKSRTTKFQSHLAWLRWPTFS